MVAEAREIKVGDAVKTLHFTKALYGRVTAITRKTRRATVVGRTQPGKATQTITAHVENLDIVAEAELAPEDRAEESY